MNDQKKPEHTRTNSRFPRNIPGITKNSQPRTFLNNRKVITIKSLTPDKVNRLHLCIRLASWNTLDEFFAAQAEALIADFESEYPGLFASGKQIQLLPGTLRVLKALRAGHSTVATISRSLQRNPLKDSVIRCALKQLVDLGIVRSAPIAEKPGAGRPTMIFTII
jgi:hypothetical protein